MTSEDIDIVVLLPDPDELTDDGNIGEDKLGSVEVSDVPGEIVVQYNAPTNSEPSETCEQGDINLPGCSSTTNIPSARKPKRRRCLTEEIFSWKKVKPIYTKMPPFSQTANTNMDNLKKQLAGKSSVEIFEEYFTSAVFEYIVEETIKYSRSKNDPSFTITIVLKSFIGILLFSGYHQLPSEKNYWSEEEDLGVNIVKECMSRNEYLKIKKIYPFFR